MQLNYLLSLGALPALIAAKALPVRRDVSCSYSAAPNTGDTCATFVLGWGLTVDQFQKLNPDAQCPNLDITKNYCVIGTVTAPGTTTTTSAPTTPPTTTTQGTSTTTSAEPTGPSPTMPGIAENCDKFHKIASGDQCDVIETLYGISDNQFKEWNSEISADCSNLWLDYYVCVHVAGATTTSPGEPEPTSGGPSPQMPGLDANCDNFHKIASGDQCDVIETKYGISDNQFKSWNSEINAECSNLWLDYYVCVHVKGATTTSPGNPQPTSGGPTPQMPGIISSCKKFHLVASGDSCFDLQQTYGVSLAQLLSWNTEVNDACTNMWGGYYICVGV
ncbi:hypothetical protein V495_01947 [Pseudogymnoascus sp. VKM F-4514 (FW-929)]|nr:hypothetical protein V495_01947 [Pseudogymnoascus sp. VKM F-4514 (FW-929)]KFY66686.1 hypothetical protein V497_00801 [Pseudogymnoascus sp. VKM F-4516 (FW-969)]